MYSLKRLVVELAAMQESNRYEIST